ncbi:MAG: carbamoyltransferase C-terminal domain-containing protein [Nostoc sp.]|uniref:carbamoyltransferase family protein n=1 Tax=Nostoc sp. TaxID=1180 RepID=UPI002FF1377F
MPRNYIGLSCSCHDPALAIVNSNGEVVFAEAAERYLQNKRAWYSPPDDLIRMSELLNTYCEKDADLILASTWQPSTLRKAEFFYFNSLFQNPVIQFLLGLLSSETPLPAPFSQLLISGTAKNLGLNTEFVFLLKNQINPQINSRLQVTRKAFDHHLTHAAAACYSSPFEEALCVIADGYGEGSSTAIFHYDRGTLKPIPRIKPSIPSLGIFFAKLCNACGFDSIKGEEWKVMGLAPYGKLNQTLYDSLKGLMEVKDGGFIYKNKHLIQQYESTLNHYILKRWDNLYDAADLAYTGQLVFSELMTDLLKSAYEICPSDRLVLSGGCALNSAFNGQVLELVPDFKSCYVFSAPGDDGNAVGAALLAYYSDRPPQNKKPAKLQSPYLGSTISMKTLSNLEQYSRLKKVPLECGETVSQKAAQFLAEGKIIGWMQGRAEFGPRALGNRSILADPRLPDIKLRLNIEVKYREEFRPFAPAILHEYGAEYFENYQETPYMERALRFHPQAAEKVPGVVHVDGTGRLQTVKRDWNPRFYDLISAFFQLTGIPLILNTSFNVMGKPIVHSVEDAIAVFMTTGMDVLIIEDRIYLK